MSMTHTVFETSLVNYVVLGSWPTTTYSDDTELMRFRVFTWRFRAPRSQVVFWRPRCDILDGDVCTVKRRPSQLRRPWFIGVNHVFRRRCVHEISCFYVTFSAPSSQVALRWQCSDILGGDVSTVRRRACQLRRPVYLRHTPVRS